MSSRINAKLSDVAALVYALRAGFAPGSVRPAIY
jgi:hypothetical protein